MKSLKIGLITCLMGVSSITSAFAAPNISLVMESKKVVVKDGKEILTDIKAAQPGDTIMYTIKVTNKGNSTAIDVEPEGKIPSNTVYINENKESPYKMEFSVDDGKTFETVPKLNTIEKGKRITKNAPIEMYNKVKWTIKKVDPKQAYSLNYKVKVK